uniref:Phosphatidylserine lipase ABHD16A n=2 Tax=Equus TaxID=9789 RepID=A0A9L0RCU0_HORSE
MLGHCYCCWQAWPASEALAAGPTPSTGSSSPSWRQHIGTSLQKTRGSSPTTTLTSGAGQSTSTGKNPAAGRSPEGALPAGVWPCFAQSPCTGGQQTPSSTESRSCLVRSPATWWRTPWGAGCCIRALCTCSRRPSCLCCCRARPGWWKSVTGAGQSCWPVTATRLTPCLWTGGGPLSPRDRSWSSAVRGTRASMRWAVSPRLWKGVPFPQNEANAMDVVVQFAIHRLGFQPQDIIIYAWSIGGFTATWAAMSYPDISAVILDASFDDLVPLALKVMPDSWRGLVTRTVRQHLNLNNAEQLCRYQGPVLLIRRTKDEIITTTVPEDIMSNRGNDLLLKLLQHRYPRVMADEGLRVVRQWLEASSQLEEASIYSRWEVEEDWCLSVLRSYQAEHGPDFPWSVGEDMSADGRRQLALFLAQKHLQNFEASHCTPFPAQNFQMPWHL